MTYKQAKARRRKREEIFSSTQNVCTSKTTIVVNIIEEKIGKKNTRGRCRLDKRL